MIYFNRLGNVSRQIIKVVCETSDGYLRISPVIVRDIAETIRNYVGTNIVAKRTARRFRSILYEAEGVAANGSRCDKTNRRGTGENGSVSKAIRDRFDCRGRSSTVSVGTDGFRSRNTFGGRGRRRDCAVFGRTWGPEKALCRAEIISVTSGHAKTSSRRYRRTFVRAHDAGEFKSRGCSPARRPRGTKSASLFGQRVSRETISLLPGRTRNTTCARIRRIRSYIKTYFIRHRFFFCFCFFRFLLFVK